MAKLRKWAVVLIIVGASLGQVGEVEAATQPPGVVLNLHGHAQQLPLSCESRSAVDLADFWGVSIPEREFFDRLPKTDNPNTGFVGNVYDSWGQLPPNGYGVHAVPLAAGRPVILWATPRMATQPVEAHTTSDGQTVGVVRYEHTIIAMGYTQGAVSVVDAGNGHRWSHSNQALLSAWDKLGQMSVVVHGNGNAPAASAPAVAEAPPPVNAVIAFQSPAVGGVVGVPVEVRGTAQMTGFRYYEVWYGMGNDPAVWNWVSGPHRAPVQDGRITQKELSWLAPGSYTIRVVVYGDGEPAVGQTGFTVAP